MVKLKDKLAATRIRLYQRFYPQKRSIKQIEYHAGNFIVSVKEDIGWLLSNKREYERTEIEHLEELINDDDVCVDVGANIGLYSVFMARKARVGQVFAFEPLPHNRTFLVANAQLNGITNIQIYDWALSDTVGVLTFSVSEDPAYSSIRFTNRKKESLLLNIQSNTLDNFFTIEGLKVDVIKIDVEGAELLVLQGGERLLSTPELRPRVLLVELNAQNQAVYGYKPEDVLEYMDTFSYRAHSLTEKGLERGWPRKGCTENVLFICTGRDR